MKMKRQTAFSGRVGPYTAPLLKYFYGQISVKWTNFDFKIDNKIRKSFSI